MGEKGRLFKIIFVGNQRVGKTSLNKRYLGEGFSDSYVSTMGLDITKMEYQGTENNAVFTFWDVGWQEHYAILRQSVYMGTSGAILVFDLAAPSNPESTIDKWLYELQEGIGGQLPIVIIGNKLDLERQVTEEEGIEYCDKVRMIFGSDSPVAYFETSAKTGENVAEAINWLTKTILTVDKINREGEETKF